MNERLKGQPFFEKKSKRNGIEMPIQCLLRKTSEKELIRTRWHPHYHEYIEFLFGLDSCEVNAWIAKMVEADGILLGAPVHFSGMAAGFKAFLDRAFYVCGNNGSLLRHKVGAAITAVRRSGGVATVDSMYHYLTYSEMLLATSNYWNVTHGTRPGDTVQDGEGMQIMEVLGQNIAWLLKLKEYGKDAVPAPAPVKKTFTNFIR